MGMGQEWKKKLLNSKILEQSLVTETLPRYCYVLG